MAAIDFSILLQSENVTQIASGVGTMLQLTLFAWLLAMAVGTLLAFVRMSHIKWAQFMVAAYVEYHQNVPMLVQIFLWYFGIPALLPISVQQWINSGDSGFFFAFVAVGLAMAAYISEALRGGIRSIPSSQLEAARALGLGHAQAFRLVMLPQAFRIALPALVSHTVLLFKNTSLAMTIGVAELTYVAREIESQSFRTVEIYLLATGVYLTVSLLIMLTGAHLEARLRLRTR